MYWALIVLVGGMYFALFAYSTIKPDTEAREGVDSGEVITLNSKGLTYINSYYNTTSNELEIHFGINNIQSLFSEENLEAKMIAQKDMNIVYDATVKKETPQLISMKFSDVPEDYLVGKLTVKHQSQNSEESQSAEIYFNHEKEIQRSFDEADYKTISIEFKSRFLDAEINSLNKNLETLEESKVVMENDIETLNAEDDLLTDDEKENIKLQIEALESQIKTTSENIEAVKKDIAERQKQKQELERTQAD